jgi:hypothetical protein
MNPPPPVTSARIFGPSSTRAGRLASSSSALWPLRSAVSLADSQRATSVASIQRPPAGDTCSSSRRTADAPVDEVRFGRGERLPSNKQERLERKSAPATCRLGHQSCSRDRDIEAARRLRIDSPRPRSRIGRAGEVRASHYGAKAFRPSFWLPSSEDRHPRRRPMN